MPHIALAPVCVLFNASGLDVNASGLTTLHLISSKALSCSPSSFTLSASVSFSGRYSQCRSVVSSIPSPPTVPVLSLCVSSPMPVAMQSAASYQQSLPKQLTHIDLVLSANSEDWKPRNKALDDLEQLVTQGLQLLPYDALTELLTVPLTSLATSLTTQVTDLRSEIVRQCAHTLAFLALHVPAAFTKAAVKIFPALLKVASGTNGVIRTYAAPAAEELVSHVHNVSLLLDMLNELKTSKNKVTIGFCSALLVAVLQQWSTKLLRKYAPLIEESIVALLSAAEQQTRQSAGRSALLYLDHFPARSKNLLGALDPRAVRIVNEMRKDHVTASHVVANGGKTRNDSVTSVDSLAFEDDGEETKRPASALSNHSNGSHASSGVSSIRQPAVRYTYGQRVEIVDVLTTRGDVDDSALNVQLSGRKGTVISQAQREGRVGEWVGVRLEADVDPEEEERKGVQVVYVRPGTLRKEGWRVNRLRAPTIDTSSVGRPNSAPSSAASSSSFNSTSSLPASPAPSSGASYVTPSSARSNASTSSLARGGIPSPAPIRKSNSSTSSVATPSPPMLGRPNSTSSGLSATKLTSPTYASRSSTTPTTSRIPSGQPIQMSRTTVLPSSRIPVSQSRIQSRNVSRAPSQAPSQAPSRLHSRSNSGHFSMHGSPSHSPMFSPGSAPAVPSLSLTQPLPDRINASSPSPTGASASDLDLPALLSAHRQHVMDTTDHLGQLSTAMSGVNAADGAGVPATYCDGMIKVLSEQLMRTTRVLEMYVGVKKRILQESKSKSRRDEHDAFLDSFDNFK